MKKTYIIPGMIVVHLQHQSIICDSMHGTDGDAGLNYRGGSSNNTGGSVRTKESSGIWDEEW